MPTDELVLDQGVDQPADTGTATDVPVADSAPVDTPDISREPIAGDERTLPRWIRDLKPTRPEDFRAAKDAFFEQKTFKDKYKDYDIDATRTWLDGVGGKDSVETRIQELDTKAQEYDGLMQAVQSGDGSIADRIFESAGAKAPDIARAMMTQWSAKDPESYSEALTPVFAATLVNSQVQGLREGQQNMRLVDMLTEARMMSQYAPAEQQQAIAQAVISRVEQLIGGFTNTQPKAPGQQKASALDERERGISDREQQQFVGSLSKDADAALRTDVEAALKTYFDRRPADKDARELATQSVVREIMERQSNDKDFRQKYQAFIGRKDKDGALKLASSRQKAIVGEIAARVGRTIYGVAPVAKPPAAAPQQRVPSQSVSRPKNAFDELWSSSR